MVNMEHKKVSKFLKIIGIIFMSLSIIEIYFVIALHYISFDIDGSQIPLSELIFSSEYISLTGSVLWIFLIISMVCFAIVGFVMFETSKNNKIKNELLAKLMVVIGMVLLLGAFVKMDYLVLLGKTDISRLSGDISFQSALYDFDITPIFPAISWIYFISVNCFLMISALIIATLGIKWTLLIEKPENTK